MREATELSKEYLQDYLPGLWNGTGVEVTSIVKFPRGLSRETWFLECMNGGKLVKLVLRRDFPTLSVVPTSSTRLRPSAATCSAATSVTA